MTAYQTRVIEEKANLDELLGKLLGFIQTTTFAGLPAEEQVRLREQSGFMSAYSDVLGRRIAAFEPSSNLQEIPPEAKEEYKRGVKDVLSRIE